MSVPIQPVILLGGSGTRLWPLSRSSRPKQFLRLMGEGSIFQQTLGRIDANSPILADQLLAPIVIGNKDHEKLTVEQLAEAGLNDWTLVLEPEGRNTAPAIAVAAELARRNNPDAVLLVLPADHLILDSDEFLRRTKSAANVAAAGFLVTYGIVPERPETGYGYISRGEPTDMDDVFAIDRFVEKPTLARAKEYVADGGFYWNSGMFALNVATVIDEIGANAPEIWEHSIRALDAAKTVGQSIHLDASAFLKCPSDSIDYAVMERTNRGCVIPADIGWSDLGSFETLWQIGEKDDSDNCLNGNAIAKDTKRTHIDARSRLVATFGVDDLVVIETDDAVLVAHKDKIGDLKLLISELQEKQRRELE